MSPTPAAARSLYRSLLRELPARPAAQKPTRTPLQTQLRTFFSTNQTSKTPSQLLDEGLQAAQYLRAQRLYTTLLARYNPGMDMQEEERVRLTARRVGMDLPIEEGVWAAGGKE